MCTKQQANTTNNIYNYYDNMTRITKWKSEWDQSTFLTSYTALTVDTFYLLRKTMIQNRFQRMVVYELEINNNNIERKLRRYETNRRGNELK